MTAVRSEVVDLVFRGRRLTRDRPLIMAIINRTPDSFYDHGVTFDEEVARAAIRQAVIDGADVIDIGGVPASPGPEVSIEEYFVRNLTIGTLFAGLSGVVYMLVQRWSGGRRNP